VDRESYACYVLFVVAFISDCSLVNLALPLGAFAYALVSVKPSRMYWQVGVVSCRCLPGSGRSN
jgi:hypothetical protein